MKIAIVNDVATATEALRRVLARVPEYEVVWVAKNGAEAVQRTAESPPDLILMDLIMPGVDGVEATRQIMARSPCAILVVTATVLGHASQVFEALGAGALDAVTTPVLVGRDKENGADAFLGKIEHIQRMLGGRKSAHRPLARANLPEERATSGANRLVVIGASAGGPAALAKILSALPQDFPAAVVIVQHLDPQFMPLMAEWLANQSILFVRTAVEGDRLQKGTVLMAGTGDHLIFRESGVLGYTPEPRDYVYRPSVDIFFESVAMHWKGPTVGVLLTGMGRDGARGLKSLRTAGALTIAQDHATSAVYGMPKAAAAIDAACEVLPLDRIPDVLRRHFVALEEAHVR